MPTYDYVCNDCGHRFEEFQSMSARPLRSCPSCKQNALQRLIGAGAGVIFKGSGFYQTDYKNGAGKGSTEQDSTGKAASGQDSGGCSPKCGTPDAPAGCKMPKKSDG
jgi:putative FmdB family regulatory protein